MLLIKSREREDLFYGYIRFSIEDLWQDFDPRVGLFIRRMNAPAQNTSSQRKPRLFKRQLFLLALLHALGDSVSRTDFQKLLFLSCQELSATDWAGAVPYEFVPYKYGPFSFTSYADRNRLCRNGFLFEGDEWQLTDNGKQMGSQYVNSSIRNFVGRYNGKRGNRLIRETYRRFPYYATRSEVAKEIFSEDDSVLIKIESAKPTWQGTNLCTVGYEGRTLESYFNILLKSKVTVLCDVRRNPISRKYGFSKTLLSRTCDRLGIQYVHLPDLGIESKIRRGLKTQSQFNALFKMYEQTILPCQTEKLELIHSWLHAGDNVALTCYEHEASQCHRLRVVKALVSMHLYSTNEVLKVNNL